MTEIREIITKLKTYYKSDGFSGRLDNIIKELEAEIGVMQRQHKGSQDALKRVMAERAEDTKRLDKWQENIGEMDIMAYCDHAQLIFKGNSYSGDNIRDLIDKANE